MLGYFHIKRYLNPFSDIFFARFFGHHILENRANKIVISDRNKNENLCKSLKERDSLFLPSPFIRNGNHFISASEFQYAKYEKIGKRMGMNDKKNHFKVNTNGMETKPRQTSPSSNKCTKSISFGTRAIESLYMTGEKSQQQPVVSSKINVNENGIKKKLTE